MKANTTFLIFNCNLKQVQLDGEKKHGLPAKEVMRPILDADFRKNDLKMFDAETNTRFDYEYVKVPRDGMFLMEVKNLMDGNSLLVHIETRTDPVFVTIEASDGDANDATFQVVRVMQNAIIQEVEKLGWRADMTENNLKSAKYPSEFRSAMGYIQQYLNGESDFSLHVLCKERTKEIMDLLHRKLENKHKAKPIMRVIRAAYDAKLIEHPNFYALTMEFDKKGAICVASFNRYMTDDNLLADDKDYKTYLEEFLKVKGE